MAGSREAREGSLNGSQGSMQSPDARARVAREDKTNTHRSTPTGSLNSIDNDAMNASPDNGFSAGGPLRRAQTGDPTPQSVDMPPQVSHKVSSPTYSISATSQQCAIEFGFLLTYLFANRCATVPPQLLRQVRTHRFTPGHSESLTSHPLIPAHFRGMAPLPTLLRPRKATCILWEA